MIDNHPETAAQTSIKPISWVILALIILQFGTAFRLFCLPDIFPFLPKALNLACDPEIYPFLSYAMYSRSKPIGSQAKDVILFGILEDSREVEISWKNLDLGTHSDLSAYKFKKFFLDYIRQNDRTTIQTLVNLYEKTNHQRLIGLRVKVYSYTILKDGIKKEEKSVQDISIH